MLFVEILQRGFFPAHCNHKLFITMIDIYVMSKELPASIFVLIMKIRILIADILISAGFDFSPQFVVT